METQDQVRREIVGIRGEIAAAKVDARQREEELRARLAEAQGRLAALRSAASPAEFRHVQAGRHVDGLLRAFRRARGPLSQAEAGRRAGVGTGTLTHAMKALESDGLIRATGERDGRSLVYDLAERQQRKVTRRRAGS